MLFFLILPLFIYIQANAQEATKIESLDSFFAGVPVLKGYDNWIEYIKPHSGINIDSVGKRGIYCTLRTGRINHFPFPDSLKVRMLIYKEIVESEIEKFPNDTLESISVEGIFGNKKEAKGDSKLCFEKLKSLLGVYYKLVKKDITAEEKGFQFKEGINESFPDVLLYGGYDKILGFYYVFINYERRYSSIRFKQK